MKLPTLHYGVTRSFKWPWFGAISLVGAALAVVLLVIINSKPLSSERHCIDSKNLPSTSTLDWLRNRRDLQKRFQCHGFPLVPSFYAISYT